MKWCWLIRINFSMLFYLSPKMVRYSMKFLYFSSSLFRFQIWHQCFRSRRANDDVFPGTKIALFYRNPVVVSSPRRFNFGIVKREAAKKNVAWWWEFLRSLFKTDIGNLFRLFLKQKSGYMKFRFFRRQNPARFYRWRCQESPKTAPEHRALDRGDQFVPWSWTIFRKGFEGWFLKVYFVN